MSKAGKFCPMPTSKVVQQIVERYKVDTDTAVNIFSAVGTEDETLRNAESIDDLIDSPVFKDHLSNTYNIGRVVDYTKSQRALFERLLDKGLVTSDGEILAPQYIDAIISTFGRPNVSYKEKDGMYQYAHMAVPSRLRAIKSTENVKNIVLTEEQQTVVDHSVEFIKDKFDGKGGQKRYLTIQGMAGTGKTTIVRSIINKLHEDGVYPSIAVAALSRKAVHVLSEKLADEHVATETLYTLAGADPMKGEDKFSIDPSRQKFRNYKLIFVDEASMVGPKVMEAIDQTLKEYPNKVIIFLGDYGQIRPVEKEDEVSKKSPIFLRDDIQVENLTQRIRQGEESPILPFADKFWDISVGKSTTEKMALDETESKTVITDEGALIFDSTNAAMPKIIDSFKNAIKDRNVKRIKIVAATNKRVNAFNELIHNELFPNAEDITSGDFIIFNEPYRLSNDIIENSTEGFVINVREGGSQQGVRYQNIDIRLSDGKVVTVKRISATDQESLAIHTANLERLKEIARKTPKVNRKEYGEAWGNYYAAAGKYANIGYSYALTIHKAQGSTYDVSVVDINDIMSVGPWTPQEKAEVIYTAITRAKNVAVILDEDSLSTDVTSYGDISDKIESDGLTEKDQQLLDSMLQSPMETAEEAPKPFEEVRAVAQPEITQKEQTASDNIKAPAKESSLKDSFKIISGGQTGVDTIGLEVGKKLGIKTGGTTTPGFIREKDVDSYTTEDMKAFGLEEISQELQQGKTGKQFYLPRTEQNVINSDGTVYFATDADSAGKIATERFAKQHNKPFLLNPNVEELTNWLLANNIKTLNVAGNRGSKLTNKESIVTTLEQAITNYLNGISYESAPTNAKNTQRTIDSLNDMSKEDLEVIYGNSDLKAIKSAIRRAERMQSVSKIMVDNEKLSKKQKAFIEEFKDDPAALHFLAATAVRAFSRLVTDLQSDPDAAANYGLDSFNKDFTTMTREEILSDASVLSAIYDITKDVFDPTYAGKISSERYNQLKLAYDNFKILMSLKSDLLKRQEHIILDEEGNIKEFIGKANDADETDETDKEDSLEDEVKQEMAPRDSISLSNNDYSVMAKISQNIKVMLSIIENKTRDGNPVYDEFGFNLPTYIDSTEAVQSLLNWLQGCETKSEMFDRLHELAYVIPWINDVVSQLDSTTLTPMQERLASQFFVDMYKIQTRFSQSFVTTKNGRMYFWHKDLGVNKKKDNLLKSIINRYNEGKLAYQYKGNIIIAPGSVINNILRNTALLANGQPLEGSLYAAFQDSYSNPSFYTEALDDNLNLRKDRPFYELYNLIRELGIELEPLTLPLMLGGDVSAENFEDTMAHVLFNSLNNIASKLANRQIKIENNEYIPEKGMTPFSRDDRFSVYYDYQRLIDKLLDFESVDAEPMVYDNNKAHYVYANPSYMQMLIYKLKDKKNDPTKFAQWFDKRYDAFTWYSPREDFERGIRIYNLDMLQRLRYDPNARAVLDYSQKLSHNGTQYTKQSDKEYVINILTDYFFDKEKKRAWYRAPIASDKPSDDTIRWFRDSTTGYDKRLAEQAFSIMIQEAYRAKSVVEESLFDDKSTKFKFYDIDFKKDRDKAARHKNVVSKIKNNEIINIADIKDADGNYLYAGTGAAFHYLPELNQLILQDTELGNALRDAVFNKGTSINDKVGLFVSYFKSYMDDQFIDQEMQVLTDLGLFETKAEKIPIDPKDPFGKTATVYSFKYLNSIIDQYKSKEERDIYSFERDQEIVTEAIREFCYNNRLVRIQLAQLIGGDLAFYGDTVNFQKRFAQAHSSGLMFDKEATIKHERVFDDEGKLRSLTIKSYKAPSMFKENVRQAFQNKINSLGNTEEDAIKKKALIATMASVLDRFDEVDATDGQAFSCLTSFRKKQIGKGEWSFSTHDDDVNCDTDEAVYQRFIKGEPTERDFYHVFGQIRKPFVFKKIAKTRHSKTAPVIEVPMQDKNSEYMLAFLGAFVQRWNPDSTMAAMFKWMEDSHRRKDGSYNPSGVDTINFDSAVKEGNHLDVIDISDPNLRPSEVIARLNKAYNADGSYNETYVDTYDIADYKEQQVNPEHFKKHAQQMGAQVRVLAVAALDDIAKLHYKGKEITGKEVKSRYFNALVNMVRLKADKLADELKVTGEYTTQQKQYAISNFVKRMFNANQKYNIEDKMAISIVDGRPVLSWEDESLAVDIQAVLASAVKKAIYELPMNGGPVVQTTGWGIDRTLNIVFYNKQGEPLPTLSQFAKKIGKTVEEAAREYSAYIKDNQGDFAYYEAKIPMSDAIKEFALANGITDEQTLLEALPKELLEDVIGYRIPTEWKYSIFPIKIVGFTNENSGDSVMLPLDGTLISGFDFDTDKLFIMYKYTKYNKDTGKIEVITLDNYDKDNSSEEYKAWANEALDMQYASLHSEDSILEMLNPGQFEDLEEYSYDYALLKTHKYTKQDIDKMSMSQKKSLVTAVESSDITKLSWDVKMHRLNMVSKDLIAQAAVANIAHNFFSIISERKPFFQLIPKNFGFTFDGIPVMEKIQVDAKYAKDGSLIATNLCKYIGASADGAKNPVLGRIGVTQLTFNIVDTLLRWGFSNRQATLFVTQPVIQELVYRYEDAIQENPNMPLSSIVNRYEEDLVEDITGRRQNVSIYRNRDEKTSIAITSENLFERLTVEDANRANSLQPDIQLLEIFKTIYTASRQLGTIGEWPRHNSVVNGPASTIGGIISQKDKRNQIPRVLNKNFNGLTFAELQNAVPFVTEIINQTNRLVNDIILSIFPSYNSALYNNTSNTIKSLMDVDYLDQEMQDNIHKAMKLYCMAKPWASKEFLGAKYKEIRSPIIDMRDKATLEHYAFRFVDWYDKQKAKILKETPEDYAKYIEGNPFIDAILKEEPSSKYPVRSLVTNISGISKDTEALLQNGWTKLVNSKNPKVRALGIELFLYFGLRSHLAYSPKTPFHIAPTAVKVAIPNYNSAQDSMNFYTSSDINELAVQFVLNNTDDPRLVPVVDFAKLVDQGILQQVDEEKMIFRLVVKNSVYNKDINSIAHYDKSGYIYINRILKHSGTDSLIYIQKVNAPLKNALKERLLADYEESGASSEDFTITSEEFTIKVLNRGWGALYDFAEYIPGKDPTSPSVFAQFENQAQNLEDSDDGSYHRSYSIPEGSKEDTTEEGSVVDVDLLKASFKEAGIDYHNDFDSETLINNISSVKQTIVSGAKLSAEDLLLKLGYKGVNNAVAASLVSSKIEKILKEKNVC